MANIIKKRQNHIRFCRYKWKKIQKFHLNHRNHISDSKSRPFPRPRQQNYLPIINIAEKQIFINKADNNQRLHIEHSKPYLSATITDISEGKAFILLNLDVKVKDNPETKLRELSDFIQKQFPTAQWQLLNE